MDEKFIDDIKDYVKVDGDDAVLNAIVSAAIEKCENETGKAFDASRSLYAQAVKMIVADWYDHRGSMTTENIKELPASAHVQNILNHIAVSTEYEEVSS